jgi:hypothetical protein
MLARELVKLGRLRASIDRVKAVIWAFNPLLTSEGSLPPSDIFEDARINPVRLRQGSIELRSSKSNFSIVDLQKYADAFTKKAMMADFTLTEVHNLRPFIKWLDLENRYLSRSVTEKSRFDGVPAGRISNPDRDLSCKAHALFR